MIAMRDTKKAASLRVHLQDLLDRCGDCPKRTATGPPDTVHAGCPLYTEIRAAGKELANLEQISGENNYYQTLEMSIPEYYGYRSRKLTDERIAELKETSIYQVSHWKKSNGIITSRIGSNLRKIDFSVDEYKKLKAKNMPDQKIRERLHLSRYAFENWKIDNGLPLRKVNDKRKDEEIIPWIRKGKSAYWIEKHLHVGQRRAQRLVRQYKIDE